MPMMTSTCQPGGDPPSGSELFFKPSKNSSDDQPQDASDSLFDIPFDIPSDSQDFNANDELPFHETVLITFADPSEIFEVNKAMISHHSKIFAAAFDNGMTIESIERKIKVHQEPSVVQNFLNWINNNDLSIKGSTGMNADNFWDWIDLYLFGDFYDVRKLRNAVVDKAYTALTSQHSLPFTLEDISITLTYLPPYSKLYTLLINGAGCTHFVNIEHYEAIRWWYPQDLVTAIRTSPNYNLVQWTPRCEWHEHRSFHEALCCTDPSNPTSKPFDYRVDEDWWM